jgi:glycosyltransferase involved in cell wall biosynthesis
MLSLIGEKMKFSIVVPVYNAEDFLEECLDSLIGQTYQDWECICVDDGSKDCSGAICDSYAERDHRFKVVHQENKGLTAARNVGLLLATGDYICFLDNDDLRSEDWIEKAHQILSEFDVDALRMSYIVWDGKKRVSQETGTHESTIRVYRDYKELLKWKWEVISKISYVWLFFVRRSVLHDFQFKERRIYREDIISSFDMLQNIKTLAQIDYPACLYRQREGSMITSKIKVEELIGYWEEYFNLLKRQEHLLKNIGYWNYASEVFTLAIFGSLRNWVCKYEQKDSITIRRLVDSILEFRYYGVIKYGVLSLGWRGAFSFFVERGVLYPFLWYTKMAIKYVAIRQSLFKR